MSCTFSQNRNIKEALNEEIQPEIKMCRMRKTLDEAHGEEAREAEWGKKNPGQS